MKGQFPCQNDRQKAAKLHAQTLAKRGFEPSTTLALPVHF
jgi:hypothetical protein